MYLHRQGCRLPFATQLAQAGVDLPNRLYGSMDVLYSTPDPVVSVSLSASEASAVRELMQHG